MDDLGFWLNLFTQEGYPHSGNQKLPDLSFGLQLPVPHLTCLLCWYIQFQQTPTHNTIASGLPSIIYPTSFPSQLLLKELIRSPFRVPLARPELEEEWFEKTIMSLPELYLFWKIKYVLWILLVLSCTLKRKRNVLTNLCITVLVDIETCDF